MSHGFSYYSDLEFDEQAYNYCSDFQTNKKAQEISQANYLSNGFSNYPNFESNRNANSNAHHTDFKFIAPTNVNPNGFPYRVPDGLSHGKSNRKSDGVSYSRTNLPPNA